MHYLKKIPALLLICLSLFSIKTNAQKKVGDLRLGYGLNGGFPFDDVFNYSLGVDGRLQYDISLKTSLTGTAGFTHLFNNGDKGDLGMVPIRVGFKSFFGDQFYVLGELGAGIGTHQGMGTTFIWAPGAGVATKHVDISIRYENYNQFNTGQISLRLAYGYKINHFNVKK
jgi:hypothetical protein